MSDQTTDYDENTEGPDIRELREAADRSHAHRAEADAAKRELAFVKAGIDTDSKRGKHFASSYQGDLESEAIKAEYADLFGPSEPTEAPVVEDRDSAAVREALVRETAERRDLANAGASVTPPSTVDPRIAAREQFDEDLRTGVRRETAAGGLLAASIAAANAGVKGATVT